MTLTDENLNRQIIEGNIDRDQVGRVLTPEAREAAVSFVLSVWKGNMGNGEAAEIGIKHALHGVFRDDR